MTYTFRSTNSDATITEVEPTAEQALDVGAGKPITYFPRGERPLAADDGQIIQRESARPQPLNEAA